MTFLDSDDTVTSDWISSLLAETGAPGTALVSCGYAERLEGSDVVRRARLPHPVSPSVGPIVALIETGGSYLLDRELFLAIGGFDPEQRAAQHQELALRLGPELDRRGRCGAAWSCGPSSSAGWAAATTSAPTTPPCSPAPSGSSTAIATASRSTLRCSRTPPRPHRTARCGSAAPPTPAASR